MTEGGIWLEVLAEETRNSSDENFLRSLTNSSPFKSVEEIGKHFEKSGYYLGPWFYNYERTSRIALIHPRGKEDYTIGRIKI